MSQASVSREQVYDALREVIDPEVGVNIVDLGLIYGVDIDDSGHVRVQMTMTTPACPAGSYLADQARETISRSLARVKVVTVDLVWEPEWNADMMSEAAKRQLGWSEP